MLCHAAFVTVSCICVIKKRTGYVFVKELKTLVEASKILTTIPLFYGIKFMRIIQFKQWLVRIFPPQNGNVVRVKNGTTVKPAIPAAMRSKYCQILWFPGYWNITPNMYISVPSNPMDRPVYHLISCPVFHAIISTKKPRHHN